jgi:hypothetical protein
VEVLAGMVEVNDLHGITETVLDQVPDPFGAVINEDRLARLSPYPR